MRVAVRIASSPIAEKVTQVVNSWAHHDSVAKKPIVLADDLALDEINYKPEDFVIGVVDPTPARLAHLLAQHEWLTQLVSPDTFDELSGRRALRLIKRSMAAHAGENVDTLAFIGRKVNARRALLYSSSEIDARLDRFQLFAESLDASARSIEQLRDVGFELLHNAFYDAPFEAGAVPEPPKRSEVVELPPHLPAEIVYGATDDLLFVRVRDRYGSLRRPRFVEVLQRCARDASQAVALDESRGGAGLGMWRVFKTALLLVVWVNPGISTEILVGLPLKSKDRGRRARSVHLFFQPQRPSLTTFELGKEQPNGAVKQP
jgi:hypothetical protein